MVGSASFVNDASPKPIENLNEWAGEEERKCPMKKQLWLLVPLAILAMGESCPTAVDDDGDGYTEDGGDCNDADPAVHPGAAELCNEVDDDCDGVIYGPSVPETCDGIDNNCNELIDESPWYRDADSDGFGDEEGGVVECHAPDVSIASGRGDCNDEDPSFYPGALDMEGDEYDKDCAASYGGGPDPFVGLPNSFFPTIQQAVDSAIEGTTIWVGPGIYAESVDVDNSVNLRSTHSALSTILEGTQTCCDGLINSRTDFVLDGFTIQDSQGSNYGGGVWVERGYVEVKGSVFYRNIAGHYGGAIHLNPGARASIGGCVFVANEAGASGSGSGGALYVSEGAEAVVTNSVFMNNSILHAYGGGGGIMVYRGTVRLENVLMQDNWTVAGIGTDLYIMTGYGEMINVLIPETMTNSSVYVKDGGEAYMLNFYSGNTVDCLGGACLAEYSGFGGGYLDGTIGEGVLFLDIEFAQDGYHIARTSPFVNAGDPAILDPDGSMSDIGLFGGPGADGLDPDMDGWPAYFWPGEIEDAPAGFDSGDYDRDSFSPLVH
ncbi:MAG: lipoprotein [Candidatus Peregrinibacteria bacterium GW2011_GWF2_39_17]|nr:MAG: lipoprotein [Candidatus Peregrinibacteria bacterium GW2011_GWF2_39_17]